jgi:glycosyltransferase involved in cell wall biosynthesis
MAERILGWKDVPFVFDFDDAIWVRYLSPANLWLSHLRFPGKTSTLCRLARHVMVGNPYLKRYASQFSDRVSVVPTTIDTALYRPRKEARNNPPVIGWTGSYSTVQYLAAIRPALERLRRRRDFRVVVVGGEGFRAEGVDVESRPWSSLTELEDISLFDVGVMPLPDAEWERGKCGLKALQYMALGIPTVASPVGVNGEIITHAKNGLLATTDDQWEGALDRLLMDSDLREELSRAGRSTVESSYSASIHAPRVADIFREAAR